MKSIRALGSIMLLIVLIFGITYISDKSETCIACHSINNLSQPHNKLECIDCHTDSGFSGKLVFKMKQLRMFLSFERYRLGSSFECLPNSKCLRCHDEIKKTIKSKTVAVRHSDFIQITKCIECHENSVHAVFATTRSTMEKCLNCHNPKVTEEGCKPCHSRKLSLTAFTRALGIEHSSNFYKTHGYNLPNTCNPCHKVDFCQRCHPTYPHKSGFKQVHGKLAKKNISECRTCHLITKCNNCHGIEMPHTGEWKEIHGKQAVKDWSSICSRCHSLSSCSNCHLSDFIDEFEKRAKTK
ncbi:MAG: hypothetical protein N2440_01660 [Actinobacteria bacterium]|nr:hypothetical protein [Actinomycetota bacterium]